MNNFENILNEKLKNIFKKDNKQNGGIDWTDPKIPKMSYKMAPTKKYGGDDKVTFTIITKEATERASKKSGPTSLNTIGYHFLKSYKEALKLEKKYKVGGKYKNETIIQTYIAPEDDGMGKGQF